MQTQSTQAIKLQRAGLHFLGTREKMSRTHETCAVTGALSPETEMGTFKIHFIEIFFSLQINSTLKLPLLLHN